MSSNRFEAKQTAINLDWAAAFAVGALSRDELVALLPRLEEARRAVQAVMTTANGERHGAAALIALPERMLADYGLNRRTSGLGRILAAAKRMLEAVDRVVIVGSAMDRAAARALFAAGCHPYHNEQGRGDRGGRPRIYFAGEQFDNDQLAGLLDLLPHQPPGATVNDRWGIIAIDSECRTSAASCDDETTPAAAAFGILLAALRRSCRDAPERLERLVMPIARPQSRLAGECEPLAIGERFQIPPETCTATAVFSAAGLLPASVMGLDIVRLLQGATAMNERFHSAPIGDNPPLDFAGILELMRRRGGGMTRPQFFASSRGAAAVAEWCGGLWESENWKSQISNSKSEISDSKSQISNLEFQISNSKSQIPDSDMDRRGLTVNLIVESVRRDRIAVEPVDANATLLGEVGKSLPELNADTVESAKAAAASRPTVDIKLPALDEFSLGQLFQMLIIARVLEARLAN